MFKWFKSNLCAEDTNVLAKLPPAQPSSSTATLPTIEKPDGKVTTAANAFGAKLHLKLADENQSFVFSPLSIFTALSMCYAGASDTNFDEMHQVLMGNSVPKNLPTILQEMNTLITSYLNCGSKTKLKLANAFFADPAYPFKQSYMNTVQTSFMATIENEISAAEINRFVKVATERIIKEIVTQEMLTSAVGVLVNAIYFKGIWVHKFDSKLTDENGSFYNLSNNVVTVPMMKQHRLQAKNVFYGTHKWNGSKFQSLTLPYKDNTFSMVFIRPDVNSASAFKSLCQDVFSREHMLLASIAKEQQGDLEFGTIQIPRFKLETSLMLNQPLMAMGMQQAFAGGFDNMVDGENELRIGLVMHKAFIEVNEEGTVAAAATAVVMFDECKGAEPTDFILDRPFICLLQHNDTGTIAFAAQVTKI